MDCATVQSLLFEYVRGSVRRTLVPQMARHIDKCPRCKRVHDGFRALSRQNAIIEWLETRRKEVRRDIPLAA